MVTAWSIGTSKRGDLRRNDTPGPGSYTPYKHHNQTPSQWKIGTDNTRSKKMFNRNPGPGQYEPSLSKTQTLKNFPQYVFGIKNYKYQYNDTPGPGCYQQNENKIRKDQPKYTFGIKTETYLGNNHSKYSPSPADYFIDRDKCMVQRPSSKIGTANRKKLYETGNTPGVGNYQIEQSKIGPKYSFGSAVRSTSAKSINQEVPGPGQYNQQSQLKLTYKTMGIKTINGDFTRQKREQPGPSDYSIDVNLTKRSATGVKIGTQLRGQVMKEEIYKPGPNLYRPQSVDKKRFATYKIGTESRGKIMNRDNPGPGTYNINRNLGSSKKYPIGEKMNQTKIEQIPGPSDYDCDVEFVRQRPASCKIGTSNRTKFEASKNPGPGQYFISKDNQGPHITFGRDQRGHYNINEVPGPGTYQIRPKFADVPEYLIQQQTKLMV